MLTTSMEYLQALREEKYLQFLEWPEFVALYYQINDADDLLTLLIYEWINNGFCQEDAKKIALLCAVEEADLDNKRLAGNTAADGNLNYILVLPGKLSYILTSLTIVVLHCLVLEGNNQIRNIVSSEKKGAIAAKQVINTAMSALANEKYQQDLLELQERFNAWLQRFDKTAIIKISQAIKGITELRYIVEQYLTALANHPDNNKLSRISEVLTLAKYLNEQMELTPQVLETVGLYVRAIRELHPAAYEEDYLSALVPLPLVDNTLRVFLKFGRGLFGVFEKRPEEELFSLNHKI